LLWIFQIGAFSVNFGIGIVYTALPVLSHYLNEPVYYGLFLSAISLGMVSSTLVVSFIKKFPFGKIMVITFLMRSEEHTSELQSRFDIVCRLLLEKKKILKKIIIST